MNSGGHSLGGKKERALPSSRRIRKSEKRVRAEAGEKMLEQLTCSKKTEEMPNTRRPSARQCRQMAKNFSRSDKWQQKIAAKWCGGAKRVQGKPRGVRALRGE